MTDIQVRSDQDICRLAVELLKRCETISTYEDSYPSEDGFDLKSLDISSLIYEMRQLLAEIVAIPTQAELANLKPQFINIIDLIKNNIFNASFIRNAPRHLQAALMINPDPLRMLVTKYQLKPMLLLTLNLDEMTKLMRKADIFVDFFEEHNINFSDLQHLELRVVIDLINTHRTVAEFASRVQVSVLQYLKLPSNKIEDFSAQPQRLQEIKDAAQLAGCRPKV